MANETEINAETSKVNPPLGVQIIQDDDAFVDRTQTIASRAKTAVSLVKTQRFLLKRTSMPRNLSFRHLQRHWLSSTESKFPRIRDQCPKLLKKITPYLTIGTLYILSDPIMDFGFVVIPPQWTTGYYVSRYTAVILFSLAKFLRKRRHPKSAPIFVQFGENLSSKQRRRSPAARLRRSVEK